LINIKNIKNALEIYYLTNGSYPNDELRGIIEIQGCTTYGAGIMKCPNTHMFYDYGTGKSETIVRAFYPKDWNEDPNWRIRVQTGTDQGNALRGEINCVVRSSADKTAVKVCQSMGTTQINNTTWRI
jgi:hypothetical protein